MRLHPDLPVSANPRPSPPPQAPTPNLKLGPMAPPPQAEPEDKFSYTTLWRRMSVIVDKANKEYLKVWDEIARKQGAFLEELEKILSKLQSWINAVDGKPNEISLDVTALRKALKELLDKYSSGTDSVLVPPEGQTLSEEQAKAWADSLGDNYKAERRGENDWVVRFDVSQISKMLEDLPKPKDGDSKAVISLTEYSGWYDGFKLMHDELKNTVQVFAQKYANAHSTVDFLSKTLSSLIDACRSILTGFWK